MNFLGWTIHVPPGEDRDALVSALLGECCECLNLCASAGCSCRTGEPDPPVCEESSSGRAYPRLHSEGPGWSISATCLENTVKLEVHYSGPLIGLEADALHRRIVAHGFAAFVSSGSGANSL